MSPTTSSVAQNLFYAQNNLFILLTFRSYPHFLKYYNILKRKKVVQNKTTFLFYNYLFTILPAITCCAILTA